jgi:hypothetical protein
MAHWLVMKSIQWGQGTVCAQRVACGTVDQNDFFKLKANAIGSGARGGVATYKRGASTKMQSIGDLEG